MKKKAAKASTTARRPPPSEAAAERVRRHLAGEQPLPLDPAEAAGAVFISQQDRARERFARIKEEREAEKAAAAKAARSKKPKKISRPPR